MSSLAKFTHNPTEVRAIQVARPFKRVADAVPFAHAVYTNGTHKFQYIKISRPGTTNILRAYEGDWIVDDPVDGWLVMSDESFQYHYADKEDDGDSDAE
ncbi:hypothetical protein SSEA_SKINNY_46 [Mycobacterium phage Skinny]|uniref:Uncharacterized protein n=6 Tax=Bongovirus bongo TaxID=1983750 RepID=A0A0M4R066_9CAUD|nr:hypothetical protein PEGLEG_45 [Mycobacterium phage PegLeg]YP_009604903.1 hypothetical protein FDH95_gp045 [Mycobacterium phage Bongo]ALF00573.1 hypothetical protein SEA_BRICOLE_45 [Mycobacterium phage Bricole]AXQ52686.1 hypothetical protein SEA_IPHANE7_45 [Mycobacterium phage IPhane7]QDH93618.1 hypothetical protein SEA_LILHOMIEP_44 [Mycobacterium phage LilhomieP]QGJ93192.1 hypothetical protein SEA_TYDAWG_45 [Mycobacterium phage TyDawg]QUU29245.1 hypothetical protein [Mycobacterium phage S